MPGWILNATVESRAMHMSLTVLAALRTAYSSAGPVFSTKSQILK